MPADGTANGPRPRPPSTPTATPPGTNTSLRTPTRDTTHNFSNIDGTTTNSRLNSPGVHYHLSDQSHHVQTTAVNITALTAGSTQATPRSELHTAHHTPPIIIFEGTRGRVPHNT